MVVHSEKEAHVVRVAQQLELLVAHPERVGQIVRTPAAENLPMEAHSGSGTEGFPLRCITVVDMQMMW